MNLCVSIGAFATIEKARKQLNSFDIIKASSSVCCVSCACFINSQGAQYDTRKDLTGEESRMCQVTRKRVTSAQSVLFQLKNFILRSILFVLVIILIPN